MHCCPLQAIIECVSSRKEGAHHRLPGDSLVSQYHTTRSSILATAVKSNYGTFCGFLLSFCSRFASLTMLSVTHSPAHLLCRPQCARVCQGGWGRSYRGSVKRVGWGQRQVGVKQRADAEQSEESGYTTSKYAPLLSVVQPSRAIILLNLSLLQCVLTSLHCLRTTILRPPSF